MSVERKIEKWRKTGLALFEAHRKFTLAMGVSEVLPISEISYKAFEEYTDMLSEHIGDVGGWLSWYCHENDMGERGMKAALKGEKMKRIKTVKDLLNIMELDDVKVLG